jgi:putative transposase
MAYDPNLHHRRSIRLKGYDYRRAGAYFITIVTRERMCCFGEVGEGGNLQLNRFGKVVVKCWQAIPTHAPHIQLDAFVLMPNHFHGILWITKAIDPPDIEKAILTDPPLNGTNSGSLNAIVQNFKSVSTRKLNQQARTPKATWWQRDYYEVIIRDARHLAAVRHYIDANPARWHSDRNHR